MCRFESRLLQESYDFYLHKSGLRIYVFPKKMTGISVSLSVEYGAMDNGFCKDRMGKIISFPQGIAHFLEHKMFENEDGSDSFAHFSAFGADANAYTSCDSTSYVFNCTDRFEDSLTELLTFVTHPYFTEASVKKEIPIIAEEIRMYDDNPWDRGYQNLLRAMYQNHPVRESVCGSVQSIEKITAKDLQDAYDCFYVLSNMVLAVCGDVTLERVLKIADRVLPQEPKEKPFERIAPVEPERVFAPCAEAEMQVSKPIFYIGIKDLFHPKSATERIKREATAILLKEILFSASGELYQSLLEQNLITPGFGCGYESDETFSFLCLSGESDEPEKIFQIVKNYMQNTAKNGISDEDFRRCQKVLYADEVRDFDSVDVIASRLVPFAFDGVDLFSFTEQLLAVTKNDVMNLLFELSMEQLFAYSVILPMKEEKD